MNTLFFLLWAFVGALYTSAFLYFWNTRNRVTAVFMLVVALVVIIGGALIWSNL